MAIYWTFDISPEDATAPSNAEMDKIYEQKGGVSTYTGTARQLSENGKIFEHDINVFAGCSWAIIFLLDIHRQRLSWNGSQILCWRNSLI